MRIEPITLADANAFVKLQHRHNDPTNGHRFSISVWGEDPLLGADACLGVAITSWPVAKTFNTGHVAEVQRLCVYEDAPLGACSMLYAAAWRAWKAMGGKKIITYTLLSESGASLRGAGWVCEGPVRVNKPDQWQNRKGRKSQEVVGLPKQRWSCSIK